MSLMCDFLLLSFSDLIFELLLFLHVWYDESEECADSASSSSNISFDLLDISSSDIFFFLLGVSADFCVEIFFLIDAIGDSSSSICSSLLVSSSNEELVKSVILNELVFPFLGVFSSILSFLESSGRDVSPSSKITPNYTPKNI